MPNISCPKCQGKLRFPEDSPPRRVKCPTCGHVFQAGNTAASARSAAEPRTPRDEDDRPRRRDDEDDDERRDRRSRRDEDDRVRRRRDDEDDYDDDRGRRRYHDDDDEDRRRRRRDDDEYEDRRRRGSRRAVEGQFNRASLACLLCFIGGWLQVGALAVLLLFWVLQWAELREGLNVFVIIAGLLGLASLLVSATGYGFLVSGPRDRGALGLSIATAAVAAFHLILLLVIATTSFADAPDQRYASVNWFAFVTELPAIPRLLFWQIGFSSQPMAPGRGIHVMPIFCGLAELAKIVLFLLTLRAISRCARDANRARHCMQAMLANTIGFGVLLALGILFGVILSAILNERAGVLAIISIFSLIYTLTIAALSAWTTMVTKAVKDGIDYRRD
jgi:DNA-directed RNA polymerase subunit M/transcription elongation factor TFIIS